MSHINNFELFDYENLRRGSMQIQINSGQQEKRDLFVIPQNINNQIMNYFNDANQEIESQDQQERSQEEQKQLYVSHIENRSQNNHFDSTDKKKRNKGKSEQKKSKKSKNHRIHKMNNSFGLDTDRTKEEGKAHQNINIEQKN